MNKHSIGFTIRAIGVIAFLLLPLLFLVGCGTAKSSGEWGADGSYKVASSGRSILSSTAAKNLQSQQSIDPSGAYNREFGADELNTQPDAEAIGELAGAITEGAVRAVIIATTGNAAALIPRSPTPAPQPRIEFTIPNTAPEEQPRVQVEPVARNPPAIEEGFSPDLIPPTETTSETPE